jgi:hypothetical protein
LGMEMISGAHAELHGYKTLTYTLLTDLEESLELIGIALWLFGLLTYLEMLAGDSQSQRSHQTAVAR